MMTSIIDVQEFYLFMLAVTCTDERNKFKCTKIKYAGVRSLVTCWNLHDAEKNKAKYRRNMVVCKVCFGVESKKTLSKNQAYVFEYWSIYGSQGFRRTVLTLLLLVESGVMLPGKLSIRVYISVFFFFWWSVFQQLRLCRDLKGKSKPRMMYPLRSVWFCIHPSNQVVTWYNAWISEDWDLFEWTLTTTEVFATNSFFTNPGQRLTFWSVHLCANQVGYRPILRKVLRRYMHYYEILVS